MSTQRVAITRPEPGRLATVLELAGIEVLHVPLIEIAEPLDLQPLDDALSDLGGFDWVVVTSAAGAERIGRAAGEHPTVRLAAVGAATAQTVALLAGRAVDVVPHRHTAADLCDAMPSTDRSESVLVAQADRADSRVADQLRAKGYRVDVVIAYRTVIRSITHADRRMLGQVDAVTFASGSAAVGWRENVGEVTPPIVVAIGPSTAAAARQLGLQVTHVSADHNLDGLAETTIAALGEARTTNR